MLRPLRGNRFTAQKRLIKMVVLKIFGISLRISPYHIVPYDQNLSNAARFMQFERVFHLIADINGPIVECGVGPGRSIFDFLLLSEALGKPRHIYGYDTFEGLPEPTAADGEWNAVMEGAWNNTQEQVKDQLALAGIDRSLVNERVTFVKGEFSETLPTKWEDSPIALLHLDCDIYESYKVVLERMYPHVASGGVIAFDEYGTERWPGATMAIDEFFADKPEKPIQTSLCAWDAYRRYYVIKK